MSNLAFGIVRYSRALEEVEVWHLAWNVCRCAFNNDIWAFFGHNIPQPVVFEMLGKNRLEATNVELPYLLTSGPLADTSDGVLTPGESYHLSDDTPVAPIVREKLVKVQKLLEGVHDVPLIRSTSLYLSDGFSPEFETDALESPMAFAESAFRDWLRHGEFSSRRYLIDQG
jgi:hypothetical protein